MGQKESDSGVKGESERKQKRMANKKYYGKTANLYPRHLWTQAEERMVLEHSIPDSELSIKLGRSLKGIQEKRRRLKKVKAETSK